MTGRPALLQSRLALRLWLAAMAVGLLALGVHLTRVGRNWPLGDWLINYEGGFVRRGLIGEALLVTGRTLHTDPVWLAALLCLLCYGVVVAWLWRVLQERSQPWWVVFGLMSPAVLSFPLLETRAGFHKEVLLYAAVVLMLTAFGQHRRPRAWAVTAGLSAAVVFLGLSHEPILFYLPYLFAIPALATCDWRYTLRVLAVPTLLTVATFVLVTQHIGSASTVAAICASVHASAADPCADPIGFLTMTRAGQLAMVRQDVAQLHYWRKYPVLLALALVPSAMAFWNFWKQRGLRSRLLLLLSAAGLAGAGSAVLFRFGSDWGRWIAIHAVCLLLLLLWLKRESEDGTAAPSQAIVEPGKVRFAWSIALLGYALCWSLPGYGDGPMHGFLGLLLHRP